LKIHVACDLSGRGEEKPNKNLNEIKRGLYHQRERKVMKGGGKFQGVEEKKVRQKVSVNEWSGQRLRGREDSNGNIYTGGREG